MLLRTAEIDSVDDGAGKPININKIIGRRPIAAFGNSDGDLQMLQWTAAGSGVRFMLLVHHDDAEREYAYDRQSSIGKLDKALDEANVKHWTVVSMKNDWKTIFPHLGVLRSKRFLFYLWPRAAPIRGRVSWSNLFKEEVHMLTTRLNRGLWLGILTIGLLLCAHSPTAVAQAKKPNILVIFGDDIGQTNISVYGKGVVGYTTPNIDRIAKEGMLFTDYYAENSCTAGRSSFITGQTPKRTGMSKVGIPGRPLVCRLATLR